MPVKNSDANSDMFFFMKQCADDFNSFVVLRLFAGMYHQATDAEYAKAVDQLLAAFKQERMGNVSSALKLRDGNALDIEKIRIANMDAVMTFNDNVKKYLLGLKPPQLPLEKQP